MPGFKPAKVLVFFFFFFHIMMISTKDIIEKMNTFVTKPVSSGVNVFSLSNYGFHGECSVPRKR